MCNLSLNGNKYQLEATGNIKVKKVKTPESILLDFKDDIVVQTTKNKLVAIRADELKINTSSKVPYVGLPASGDKITFFDDKGKVKVEGTVVSSNNENDFSTFLSLPEEKQAKTIRNAVFKILFTPAPKQTAEKPSETKNEPKT